MTHNQEGALAERTLSSRSVYEGRIITLRCDEVALPNGRQTTREVVAHNGAVAIVALDEQERVLVVRQYRYPIGRTLLEIPAGTLERGEQPLACAMRELTEETGARAQCFTPLGAMLSSPGFSDQVIWLYLAEGLSFGGTHFDDDEFLTLSRVPLEELAAQALSGEIDDGKTIAAVLKVWMLRRGMTPGK